MYQIILSFTNLSRFERKINDKYQGLKSLTLLNFLGLVNF